MDAGWIVTYDSYYSSKVKNIFASVLDEMEKYEHYTYTVGDIAFFRRYYNADSTSSHHRKLIKTFIKNGRLEVVHGGLVSNDEATTNYADILRNFEAGHDFLREEFGINPTIGWQLDPFGHSAV